MIWLTVRQFRAQALTAVALLAGLALVLAVTRSHLADQYQASGLAACHHGCATLTKRFLDQVTSEPLYPAGYFCTAGLALLMPALIGAFWGAPLVPREVEAGTLALTWNQSVTRARWIGVKLALIGLAAIAVAGLLCLMVTWWAAPIDRAGGLPAGTGQLSRFSPLVFATRDVTPIGYAAFAFTLGVLTGLLVRRTIPAMAVTLAVFTIVQIVLPTVVRPHLDTPSHTIAAIHPTLGGIQLTHSGQLTAPANLPGAWILSNQTLTTSGRVFSLLASPASPCQSGTPQACDAWLADQHLRQAVTYQPASRFWTFQGVETAIFLALAVVLAALSRWLIGSGAF